MCLGRPHVQQVDQFYSNKLENYENKKAGHFANKAGIWYEEKAVMLTPTLLWETMPMLSVSIENFGV